MKAFNKIKKVSLLLCVAWGAVSCADLDPEVSQFATSEQINEKVKAGGDGVISILKSTMLGAYNAMIVYQDRHDSFGEMALGLAGDLMTEDMVLGYQTHFIYDYQVDNRAATYARPRNTWSYLYSVVGKCNEVIEKVPSTATDPQQKAILGEALALRAYAFHSLVQRFQQPYTANKTAPGIPLTLTENDDRPSVGGRGTVEAVYDKILADYELAVSYLKDAPTARTGKTSIDYQVAAGLFARALLSVEDWSRAAQYAKIAYTGYSLMSESEIVADNFGNISNKEWMWGADITGETTTMFASFFSHVCSYDAGYGEYNYAPKSIDADLYKLIGTNDARRKQFKDPAAPVVEDSKVVEEAASAYCNFKFKKVDAWLADYIYMRASEMYLIEAEALAQQNKGAEAYATLKVLMDNRDADWGTTRSTVTAEEVFTQKRIELWGEGHIFYDYHRLKKGINRDYSGSNHLEKKTYAAGDWHFIYQIPQTEIDNNAELSESDQNPPL